MLNLLELVLSKGTEFKYLGVTDLKENMRRTEEECMCM